MQSPNLVKATIKEDGVAITVGIDADGFRYVSRVGKTGHATRYFSPREVPNQPQFNAVLVATVAWTGSIGASVHSSAQNGDTWNVEITYPDLNVIQHECGHITFLHPLDNTVTGSRSTDIEHLDYSTSTFINVPHYTSSDGIDIKTSHILTRFFARGVRTIDVPNVEVVAEWLERVDEGQTYTNGHLIEARMIRGLALETRNTVAEKRAIFRELLMEIETPLDCEGVVLDDDKTLVKIVPQWFVEQNQFEHAVRNGIKKRSFSNNLDRFFSPAHGGYFVDEQIQRLWKEPSRTDTQTVTLLNVLLKLRDQYQVIQARGLFQGPDNQTRYNENAHNKTMVEFAWFRQQLALTLVNTR